MPTLQKIDSSAAFSRFMVLYRAKNDACGTTSFVRKKTCLDGTIVETQVERRTGLVPEQVKTTFYMMLQKYVDNYNYVAGALPANIYAESERYPSLLTNNSRLGEWCDCTDKTIYNHRKQLEGLGVIKTSFRGRKNDYELWITPEILFGGGKAETPSEASKTAFLGGERKTFPHSNIHGENIEKENRSKELCISGYGENGYRGRGRAEQPTGPTTPAMERTAQSEGAAAGGGTRAERAAESQEKRALQADEFKNNTLPALPPRLEKYFADMLLGIWLHAWRVLWPNREFSKEQQEMAIAAIYVGVFNRFEDGRDGKAWADWQARNLEDRKSVV